MQINSLRLVFLVLWVIGRDPAPARGQFIPNDFGQTVNGFQDDFSRSTRDSNWVAVPAARNAYEQANGVLRVGTMLGNPNHLLYQAAGYSDAAQEVLARIRVKVLAAGGSAIAGITVGASPDAEHAGEGINFVFVRDIMSAYGSPGLAVQLVDDFRAWGPQAPGFTWATNEWYWLRLCQTGSSAVQGANLHAKAWHADGTEREPAHWQVNWVRDGRVGFAGIRGPHEGAPAEFEVDYILIKAEGLPSIRVSPSVMILKEPKDVMVGPGQTASFEVGATGHSPCTYQWQKAKPGMLNFTDIINANDTNYTTAALAAADQGVKYRCVVSGAGKKVTSKEVMVTVDATPPGLVSARTIGNPNRVTVVFSKSISADAGSNNFAIDHGIRISGSLPGEKPNTLELVTTPIGADKTYTLTVNGIRDRLGNTILPDSRITIDLSVEVPADYGKTVEGFQDDFSGTKRNVSWGAVPADNADYLQTNGWLKVSATSSAKNHLLFKLPGYDPVEQEILARIRVTAFSAHPSARAGIGVGLNADAGEGMNLSFRDGDQLGIFGRQISLLDDRAGWGPPVLDVAWENHTWYWLRLRQTGPSTATGPNLYCKFWLADGAVPEPTDWQFDWEHEHRAGYAGILGPSTAARAELEVDYFLIKAKGLPKIRVAPDAFSLVPGRP